MWTDPGWFIYQLEVWIWFWSLVAWPPAFLYLSFSTLYSSYLWRADTIIFSKLNKPRAPPSSGLEINKLPGLGRGGGGGGGGGNRGFMVLGFYYFFLFFYFTADILSVVSFVIQRMESNEVKAHMSSS